MGSRGVIYIDLDLLDEAKITLEESIALKEKKNDKIGEAFSLCGLGRIFSNSQSEIATNYYNKALEIFSSIGHLRGKATALQGLGRIDLNKEKDDTALRFLNEALEIFRKIGDKYNSSDVVSDMGVILFRSGNTLKAKKFFQERIDYLEAIGHEHIDSYRRLVRQYSDSK